MRFLAIMLAAGLATACGSLGTYDDGGAARRTVEEAPVDTASSHETPLAEPSIRLADGKIRPRGEAAAASVAEKLCDADGWSSLIGMDREDIPENQLPEPYRIVGPDDLVTQDFRAERLNVHVDREGKVFRVTCG
jgi:hypothetical protein